MEQLLAIIVFFALATVIMGLSLHFSKYKQKSSSCCGGGHCSVDEDDHNQECENTHSCYSSKEEFVNNFDKIKVKKVRIDLNS